MELEQLTREQRAQIARDVGADTLLARLDAKDCLERAVRKLGLCLNQLNAARADFDVKRQEIESETLVKITRLRRPLDQAESDHQAAVVEHERAQAALAAAVQADRH